MRNRVILNGQFLAWRGAAQACSGRGGHNRHASLKFEKDGCLYERPNGAPKSFADENLRKLVQGGA
jgi:hypothetical protein